MNSMYCAEQIVIPPELGTILKQFTKAAIREEPKDVCKWAANFFAQLAGQQAPFDARGQLTSQGGQGGGGGVGGAPPSTGGGSGTAKFASDVIQDADNFEAVPQDGSGEGEDEGGEIVDALFRQYDVDHSGRLERSELPALVEDLRAALGLEVSDDQVHQLLNDLDVDEDGTIDLQEFRRMFVQTE